MMRTLCSYKDSISVTQSRMFVFKFKIVLKFLTHVLYEC